MIVLKMLKKLGLPVFAVMIVSGCAAVGPDYKKIKSDAPEQWNSLLKSGLAAETADKEKLGQWWKVLNDPILEKLEKQAVSENLTLKESIERVREARTLLGLSKTGFFPVLNASGAAVKSRSSESTGTGKELDLFSAKIDAGWEIDIFGGVRRSVEAAKANLEASEDSVRDAMVSLSAEVALNYINYRTYQARLVAAKNNFEAQKHTYEINLSRYKSGLIDELAVHQSLYLMEQTKSQIPLLESGLNSSINRLCVLLGKKPGALNEEMKTVESIPTPPISIAIGIPAESLRRRPDIRRAERLVAAQSAKIGVSKANLYPKLRLSGSIGLEALEAGDLTDSANGTFSIGPSITWNLFDAGAIKRNTEAEEIRKNQAYISYRSIVLRAMEEIENAITDFSKEHERYVSLNKATEAAAKADMIARDRYKAGLVDFSNVLDAQRSLSSFQDSLAQSKGTVTVNMIKLYKALGGGWDYNVEEFIKK